MSVAELVFYVFVAVAAVAAGAMLFSRNVFKSALLLLVSLLSLAGLYVLAFAELVAVAQILVYAGGVLVVIIFGIMLTTKLSGRPLMVRNGHMLTGGLVGISLFVLLVRDLPTPGPGAMRSLPAEEVSAIGFVIFSQYSVPFEIAGILLLMALIGAAVITSKLKSGS